jgi:transglutaminase-like putative cysteine protease
MTYDKKGEGWGKGDAVWACLNKKGNCTDFHSLFIALARTQKISARFRIGFPAKYENKLNEIHGYHCWAEAFIPGKGWLPLDATEGKKSAKPLEFFGQIPANRILFSTERDINLMPRQSGAALNYFIYPYVELDGRLDNDYQKKFFVRAKIDS